MSICSQINCPQVGLERVAALAVECRSGDYSDVVNCFSASGNHCQRIAKSLKETRNAR